MIRTALTLAAMTLASATFAQESTNVVAEKTDWTVFTDEDPRECWAVTIPKETVNTKDGRVVSVTRGDIYLMVFYNPGANALGQVYFRGGYTFAEGTTVNVNIGGTEFEFYTEEEHSWPASEAEDAKVVTAMKRGATAVVTGLSSRGTTTKDTFSLLGFTAAVEDAEKRCPS